MTMTAEELDILHDQMNSSARYLEFGAGSSTLYAAGVSSIRQIDSVESSESFIDLNLKPNPVISEALTDGKLLFHVIDIGKTWFWGYPSGFCKRHQWPHYSSGIFSRTSEHDLVLIDGRFRVACALNCILNTPPDCKIIIHDFWNRPKYHIVLNFLKTKARADTLGLFSKRENIDLDLVRSLINKYQYFPR
jgi:hypothetical protein